MRTCLLGGSSYSWRKLNNMKSLPILLLLIACFKFSNVDGKTRETRIVGGDVAFAGQFAFAAAIFVQTPTTRHFCGGTLTANSWVVTAGHCVYNAVSLTVQIGSNQLESDDENRVTVSTSSYILHPDFKQDSLEHDIALVKLPHLPLDYHIYLHPIHPLATQLPEDASVYLLGWGQTSDAENELTNDLRWTQLSTITNDQCRITYGNQITDNMVCVVGSYNEGLCLSDNGGALAVQNGRTYSLVGVASFVSAEGCESPHPSGFTRIHPYYEWITNITKETDIIF